MSKSDRNSGKPWTPSEVKELKELAKGNTPTRIISLKLGRTEDAVYKKANDNNISLNPHNRSPYGSKKKS